VSKHSDAKGDGRRPPDEVDDCIGPSSLVRCLDPRDNLLRIQLRGVEGIIGAELSGELEPEIVDVSSRDFRARGLLRYLDRRRPQATDPDDKEKVV
jgi:hypothetical protein